jgi:hypothetical protein
VSLHWESTLRAGGSEVALATDLMRRFAERTGLDSDRPPRRYLWTDAFAVCNYLALWRTTGEPRYQRLALRLVDQVHAVLGRHRPEDPRSGWISGLSHPEGELHPTRGGLRIGKKLAERPPGAPLDEQLEWDRDGQYFHYLTRWMHALDQVARWTGEGRFNAWARELAEVAHRAFTRASPGGREIVWKMSIDLSRPLVTSMGQHDPLDGLVTCLQLRATAASLRAPPGPALDAALSDFARLVERPSLATADPLGLGGLLVDACRVEQLLEEGALADTSLLEALLAAALAGLGDFARHNELHQPASRRLAFRELGLAIGIAGVGPLDRSLREGGTRLARARAQLDRLVPHAALGARIAAFWRDPAQRANRTWAEHEDINDVMLVTCLAPDGVLILGPHRPPSRAARMLGAQPPGAGRR